MINPAVGKATEVARVGVTKHLLREGDARDLSFIPTESVHLICTSPPYGALKTYPDHPSQLGNIAAYERFLEELDAVWSGASVFLFLGAGSPA